MQASLGATLQYATSTQSLIYPREIPRGGVEEISIRTDSLTTNGNAQPNSKECICGKLCKNQRGLKIHQGRMKCLERGRLEQRTGTRPGKTKERKDQESHHRVQSLQVRVSPSPGMESRRRIKWPPAYNKEAWQNFDNDICELLQLTSQGSAQNQLKYLTTIITSMGSERFGYAESKQIAKPNTTNRREKKIKELRKELRSLKKAYRKANREDRQPLEELRAILREKLKNTRRAEWHRRKGKERTRKRASFLSNPFGFAKKLLGENRNGQLEASAEEINTFLRESMKDPLKEQDLYKNDSLIIQKPPTSPFDISMPTWKEIQQVVRASRSASAPGPSGVPYTVYKRCGGILRKLWKLIRIIWRKGKVVEQWRRAEGVWIPKEENSTTLDQFRVISLLNTEGKIFFGVLSRRITKYVLANNYIDKSVQKGGIPGMPGCLEHTGVLTQLIRDAREKKSDLTVLWLDLANAYGSMPHKLVEEALKRHYVPSSICGLISDYYNNFQSRVSARIVSEWHTLEKGIITGCTLSAVLFSLAMNMLVKASEVECRGPLSKSGIRQPPIRAYMDDLTVTCTSVTGGRWLLKGLEENITWARMTFKPAKSRSLVIKKGKITEKYHFKISGVTIPTLNEKPVKSLGKFFDSSLRDTVAIEQTTEDLTQWLNKIDKSGLPGRFKAWLFQHAVLPRILWPLLMYEFPMTSVESLEKVITRRLRRWLGVPKCLSTAALYGRSNVLQLPFNSLVEEFKVTRVREQLQYKESNDPKVVAACIQSRTGRKWRAENELEIAEDRLRHKAILGTIAKGRAGLGYFPCPQINKTKGKERRQLIQKEVRAGIEETRYCKMVGLSSQGAWTKWQGVEQKKISWSDYWRSNFGEISFLIKSVYDVLPSPSNLYIWGKRDTPNCQLCGKRATLQHILSSCAKALSDGRYRWRHDKVLKAIAHEVSEAVRTSKYKPNKKFILIPFVKEGTKKEKHTIPKINLLSSANDWHLDIDLKTQLKFPRHIAETPLRPDLVMYSNSTKKCIIWELTVPWEEHLTLANERKRSKYQELIEKCRQNSWKVTYDSVEVGCRGFAGQSLCKAFRKIGIVGSAKAKAVKKISNEALTASKWIWLKGSEQWGNNSMGNNS